ncbi:MAG: hypothetical protein JGK29_14305 [Microcoleus sp. PH2017_17_BER_D_A]|nr:hypothetical protein [Microcoleus sp. PH2017_17_BER_D_A]
MRFRMMGWELTRKNWLKARPPAREKLKSDYSLLQSSDLRVEVALKLSTVNCQLSTLQWSIDSRGDADQQYPTIFDHLCRQ